MKLSKVAILAVVALASLTSCHHKGLEFDEPLSPAKVITVVFDWTDAPDASPESMALYLYPSDGGEPIRFSLTGREGGTIRLPADSYDALALNNDNTDWALLRDVETKSGFNVYTAPLTPTSPGGELADVIRSYTDYASANAAVCNPQMLWDGRTDNFTVTSTPEPQTLVVRMAEGVCHYTVEVRDIEGLENLRDRSLPALITDMADGHNIFSRTPSTILAAMAFNLKGTTEQQRLPARQQASQNGQNRLISDEFLTFGENADAASSHTLTILVRQADNTHLPFSFDVTDQIRQAPDPRHVHIVVSGLKIPAEPVAGGFIVNVEQWNEEYIPIQM